MLDLHSADQGLILVPQMVSLNLVRSDSLSVKLLVNPKSHWKYNPLPWQNHHYHQYYCHDHFPLFPNVVNFFQRRKNRGEIFCLVCFWTTHSASQGLFLPLHSEIISSRARANIWGVEAWIGSDTAKANALPTVLTLQLQKMIFRTRLPCILMKLHIMRSLHLLVRCKKLLPVQLYIRTWLHSLN